MSTFAPTEQQQAALSAFADPAVKSLGIVAAAGTGKTTTLNLLARSTNRIGRYLAFNKSIVTEAQTKFPMNVEASTMHSLAMRSYGRQFAHRLGQPRMKPWDLARLLGFDGPLVITLPNGKAKALQPSYLASLTLRAVRNFCSSDAVNPSGDFVPYIDAIDERDDQGRKGWKNNKIVRETLDIPIKRAWLDLNNPDGRLPYQHDHYLKGFERSGPRIEVDFVMIDECQPIGTRVLVTQGRPGAGRWPKPVLAYKAIENVEPGERVVTRNPNSGKVTPDGCEVLDVRRRTIDEDLVKISTASGKTSRYTVDHKCVVAPAGAVGNGRWCLYLMRRGESFRVGITAGLHNRSESGLRSRLRDEGGDAIWLLNSFPDRATATVAEAETAWGFGIPDRTFVTGHADAREQDKLDLFWTKRGDLTDEATTCLTNFGRRIEYPIWALDTPGHFLPNKRTCVMRACNVMPGMEVYEIESGEMTQGARRPKLSKIVTVDRDYYSGDVISLEVDRDHTYVADGIVTHNCQDVSPVMASIIEQSREAVGHDVIAVGDPHQSIYGWNGAINLFDRWEFDQVATLSQSFRFGPEIAEVANSILRELDADLKIVGSGGPSHVGQVPEPDCVLTRTNSAAVSTLLAFIRMGKRPHLIGGGNEVMLFARGAIALQAGERTSHPDLACFESWSEVQDYVEKDPLGDDLALMVKLLDEYGAQIVLDALDGMPAEKAADVVITTAHRSKGREWDAVRMAGDFPDPEVTGRDMTDEEYRLLYVAVTRACDVLDHRLVATINHLVGAGAMESPW